MRHAAAKGFTLIEVIMVILLLGIISVYSFLFIVSGVSGFVTAKENADLAQKVGLTLARISKEFTLEMKDIHLLDPSSGTDKTWVKYSYTESPAAVSYRHLALVGSGTRKSIVLVDADSHTPGDTDDQVLLDNVSSLTMTFTDYDGNAWTVPTDPDEGLQNLAEIGITLVVFLSDVDDTLRTFTLVLSPSGDEELISSRRGVGSGGSRGIVLGRAALSKKAAGLTALWAARHTREGINPSPTA